MGSSDYNIKALKEPGSDKDDVIQELHRIHTEALNRFQQWIYLN